MLAEQREGRDRLWVRSASNKRRSNLSLTTPPPTPSRGSRRVRRSSNSRGGRRRLSWNAITAVSSIAKEAHALARHVHRRHLAQSAELREQRRLRQQ